jgi:hypothetical protein
MTIETAIIICVAAAFCCYLVYRWQSAVVDMAIPPYQEPVKPDMQEQWKAASKADTLGYKQDDGALTESQLNQIKDTLEPTPLNPKAAWPFPTNTKP